MNHRGYLLSVTVGNRRKFYMEKSVYMVAE